MSDYWILRHRKYKGDLKAVANIGLSEAANSADYAQKKAEVERFLNKNFPSMASKSVWDAGCGRGDFVQLFGDKGFVPYVSDVSPDAVQIVKEKFQLLLSQAVCGKLHEAGVPKVDLVSCLDVLYHVLDDSEWESSIRKFADRARVGILIQEHLEEEASLPNVHIRWRTRKMYEDLLSDLGWTLKDSFRYTLKQSGSVLDLLYFAPKEKSERED